MSARPKPPPLPSRDLSKESGTRARVTGVLRLRPTRPGLMFDEVLVFPGGVTVIAIDGEPQLRYSSLEKMLAAHGLEPHELVAIG